MKISLLFFASLCYLSNCFGQETETKKSRLTDSVYEVYHVTTANKYVREGLYQALYQKKTAVATGFYQNNVKAGVWRFFDTKGGLLQTYNYTANKLIFEAVEDTTSDLRYFVDKELKPTDRVTKPIKIGGRYYGYLPYLRLFKLPNDLLDINKSVFKAVVELLVSPGGRLADYKVHLVAPNYERVINMNLNLPDNADLIFTPATLNGEDISSRIMIKAYITEDDHLDFE